MKTETSRPYSGTFKQEFNRNTYSIIFPHNNPGEHTSNNNVSPNAISRAGEHILHTSHNSFFLRPLSRDFSTTHCDSAKYCFALPT